MIPLIALAVAGVWIAVGWCVAVVLGRAIARAEKVRPR